MGMMFWDAGGANPVAGCLQGKSDPSAASGELLGVPYGAGVFKII